MMVDLREQEDASEFVNAPPISESNIQPKKIRPQQSQAIKLARRVLRRRRITDRKVPPPPPKDLKS